MKIIRIGICALLAFSVFAHGTVEPWSEAVLEIGAALLLIWWAFLFATGTAPALRWNWLLGPVAGLWGVAVLQYLTGLSAVPFLTKIEILKLSALGILLFLALQAFESLEHWHGFVWFLLGLGFVVAGLGILQYFTFNGKLYWFRELRYGGIPFGPYVNRNHFAGLMELIVPTGISVFVLRAFDRERLPLVAVLMLLPVGALFMAASRGGLVAFFVEVGLLLILAFLVRRGRGEVAGGAVVLLLATALVAWLGVGPALERFSTYRQLELGENRRVEMAKDTWRMFIAHPILGTGLGTLQETFPRYETIYDGLVINHAHNDYVEALAETGIIGGLFCASFLVILFRGSWIRLRRAKNTMDSAFHVGAFSACCGLLVHSLVDFNLHIPSNALLFLLQAALATSATPSSRPAPLATEQKRYRTGAAAVEDLGKPVSRV